MSERINQYADTQRQLVRNAVEVMVEYLINGWQVSGKLPALDTLTDVEKEALYFVVTARVQRRLQEWLEVE